MVPFAERLLTVLRALSQQIGGPVPTPLLADFAGCAPRTARKYAAMLEAQGSVQRPSPRGGWLPVAA